MNALKGCKFRNIMDLNLIFFKRSTLIPRIIIIITYILRMTIANHVSDTVFRFYFNEGSQEF